MAEYADTFVEAEQIEPLRNLDILLRRSFVRSRMNEEKKFLDKRVSSSVIRLGDLLDFGQLFKAFVNN